ncbi:MAG: hypothetical protein HY802_07325 [Methanobacterium sp.]|nr:hypothetical protein [Methanobacterium sp.]
MKIARDSGLYEDLKKSFNINFKLYRLEGRFSSEISKSKVYSYANETLGVLLPESGCLIRFYHVQKMYTLIEFRYYMTVQRDFDVEDFQNIYLSGIDEKLIYALDQFDNDLESLEPTMEFFQKLKMVKWDNNDIKKFSNNLRLLKNEFAFPGFSIMKYNRLSAIEDTFIKLIACCSAVKNNRDYLTKEDIVIGYKTYLKLINTEVTQYIARHMLDNGMEVYRGYVVCNTCNGYYKLQSGESPEDFTTKCECGGKLKYYENYALPESAEPDKTG